ncbi:MAG TPA: hypothetical protein VF717_04890 [Pyrinomonadaceae bacterium]|jgi:hypothetical protein
MSIWQRLFAGRRSDGQMGDVEAESRSWMVKCPCGFEQSIRDMGGVRYGAHSKGKKILRRCRECGRFRWHSVYKKELAEVKP